MTSPIPNTDSPPVASPLTRSSDRRALIVLGIYVLIAVGFSIAWFSGFRNRFVPVNFGVVEPGRIYRSGQISQQVVRRTLQDNRIGVIVNLSNEDNPDGRAEHQAADELGVKQVVLSLAGDGLGDPNVYPRALAEIVRANQQGKAVLVHCQSGAQRTGGIVATYRILVEGKSPDDAFAEMKLYGHDPKHNPLLIPFIRQHLDQWKTQFEQYRQTAATQPGM